MPDSEISSTLVPGSCRKLFDGRSLRGWNAQGSPESWTVTDGALTVHGPAATLSFQRPLAVSASRLALEFEVLTRPGARGSICIGSGGSDAKSLHVTVASPASTTDDPNTWLRTGSLEGCSHVYKNLVGDDTWFTLRLTVTASRIQVHLNELPVVDFLDLRELTAEVLSVELHCAGGDSEIAFRKIELHDVAVHPPDLASPLDRDEIDKKLRALTAKYVPVLDLHAHLKGGLTLAGLLQRSRRHGMQYGVAVNCGKGFPIENDELATAFVAQVSGQPVLAGMQAEGREWTSMFSRETAAAFHYIFTDSMTWTDNHGRRMRLWIPDEVGSIPNADDFMETLVARTVDLLKHEPIDIYVNPTFLPEVIAERAGQLWTEERIQCVVEAAARNQVAIELNDLYRLPSATFIRAAKAAGCRFTFGTNNTSPNDLRRCDYGLQMTEFCELRPRDFFVPDTVLPRAILRKPDTLRD